MASCCNESQTPKTGAGKKESSLFKCQPPEKMGTLIPKAILTSQCRLGFLAGGIGKAEQINEGKEG